MGHFILFLLGLFAIGCVLYGISAGVQIIQRGFSYLAASARGGALDKRPLVSPLPPSTEETTDAPVAQREASQPKGGTPPAEASPTQRSIDELRGIFALYQQGALTPVEFEGIKQALLTAINSGHIQTRHSDTVRKWDAEDLSGQIELSIGPELQYIRISGIFVGGVIGVLLFLVSYGLEAMQLVAGAGVY